MSLIKIFFISGLLLGSMTPEAHAQVQCSAITTQCGCIAPCAWSGSACVEPIANQQACDDGSASGTASIVAANAVGATPAAKFQGLVNKKLACCMNAYDATGVVKYDCVDNSSSSNLAFDDLWSKTDSATDGGQSYAVAIQQSNSKTTLMTGFYTLSGARCNEFSEFAGPIRRAKVNPGQVSSQQEKTSGSNSSCAIAPSTVSAVNVANSLQSAVGALGRNVPYDGSSTYDCGQAANMRRCPILVRAAMIATCGKSPTPPNAQTSYVDASKEVHCLAASTVSIHVRMEQIYDVAGFPSMEPVDLSMDKGGTTSTVSLANIIKQKVGSTCLTGYHAYGNSCVNCAPGCGGPECSSCPPGTYFSSASAGMPSCLPCPAGYSAGAANSASCAQCPANSYAQGGASTCTPCAGGLTSMPGAAACH